MKRREGERAPKAALPRNPIRRAAALLMGAAEWLACAFRVRLPHSLANFFSRGSSHSSDAKAPRDGMVCVIGCERQRSNPVGLRRKLDCFVAFAPLNDQVRG